MTRAFFLWLSQRASLRRFLESSGPARRFTARFIAGTTLEDELKICGELASAGLATTADHLGENVTTLAEAQGARDAYLRVLEAIASRKLPSTISLKLTALGFDLS